MPECVIYEMCVRQKANRRGGGGKLKMYGCGGESGLLTDGRCCEG